MRYPLACHLHQDITDVSSNCWLHIEDLRNTYGNEAPMTESRGKIFGDEIGLYSERETHHHIVRLYEEYAAWTTNRNDRVCKSCCYPSVWSEKIWCKVESLRSWVVLAQCRWVVILVQINLYDQTFKQQLPSSAQRSNLQTRTITRS